MWFQHSSLVIWYDSVTNTGELRWQNALTPANKMFFDACDGIFTKYACCSGIKLRFVRSCFVALACVLLLMLRALSVAKCCVVTHKSSLVSLCSYWWKADGPAKSAALAGERSADVFIGIDVWGRGTFGGGGYVVAEYQLSLLSHCD